MTEAYYLFVIILKSLFYLTALVLLSVSVSGFRRKVTEFFCGRPLPQQTANIFKPLAIFIKTLFQENSLSPKADNPIARLAPAFSAVSVLLVFAVIPFGDLYLNLSDLHPGLARFPVHVLAVLENGTAFLILGLLLVSLTFFLTVYLFSSRKSYFTPGRDIAKILIFNLNFILITLSLLVFTGSLNLPEFVYYQAAHGWFILRQPLAFLLLFIIFYSSGGLLISERTGELLQHNYSVENELGAAGGLILKFAQNLRFLIAGSLITLFFLGGWLEPFPDWNGWDIFARLPGLVILWPLIWFFLKTFIVLFVFIWLELTFPAPGDKQTVFINYKIILPFTVANLFLNAFVISNRIPFYPGFFLQSGILVLFLLFLTRTLTVDYRSLVPKFILPRGRGREHD